MAAEFNPNNPNIVNEKDYIDRQAACNHKWELITRIGNVRILGCTDCGTTDSRNDMCSHPDIKREKISYNKYSLRCPDCNYTEIQEERVTVVLRRERADKAERYRREHRDSGLLEPVRG